MYMGGWLCPQKGAELVQLLSSHQLLGILFGDINSGDECEII